MPGPFHLSSSHTSKSAHTQLLPYLKDPLRQKALISGFLLSRMPVGEGDEKEPRIDEDEEEAEDEPGSVSGGCGGEKHLLHASDSAEGQRLELIV